ncbi:MAG: dihydroorotase family protein [Defluviicoccus sp.]|nr:dihydroorotase family protein [Defluviicoccus sp.]MDE0384548.1 dihydroorotase family protein [Defluviicoccus sp.]
MALLAIHDARLVTEAWERPGGIVVGDDGRIASLVEADARPEADTVIDADGRLLFPGFIDAHVHMRDPGFPHKETFATGSLAAACGGVTTVMCMPNTDPPADTAEGIAAMRAAGEGASLVDFTVQAGVTPDNIADLPALWDLGVSSFEALLSDAPASMLLDGDGLARAAAAVAACGAVIGVYTGDRSMVGAALERLSGRTDFAAFAEARDPIGEAMGLARLIEVARATGARIVARQVCTARGFVMIEAARRDDPGLSMAVEATPHHLRLDGSAVDRHGPFALMVPPLRGAEDCAAARAALASGAADFVGSDHAPHAVGEKDRPSPWTVPGGTPGLDTIVPAVADLAAAGEIPWTRVAAALCATPARLFGIADRKGRLAVGADGDLALVDPALARTVDGGAIRSRAARSPFEGMALTGWPVLTVLRGRVIAEDGRHVGGTPQGRWLRRGAVDWS